MHTLSTLLLVVLGFFVGAHGLFMIWSLSRNLQYRAVIASRMNAPDVRVDHLRRRAAYTLIWGSIQLALGGAVLTSVARMYQLEPAGITLSMIIIVLACVGYITMGLMELRAVKIQHET